MKESNEWIFDDENLIEEVPIDGENETFSMNTHECISEKTMLKIFNYKNRSCLGKLCCCIFCCECPCCIKIDPLDEKYYFIRLWNKLTKESKSDSKTASPFQTLINLFAHKFVIDDLKKVRLNPNLFLLESGKRNDLEFYVPQLCNFNLFGGQEQVAQFFYFLCNACFASFFFAHRVYWFMRSFDHPDYESKIRHDLQFLNCVFQSENREKRYSLTNLFVAGSQKYLDYLNKNNFLFLYKKKLELIDKNSIVNNNEIEHYNKIINAKKIISSYSDYMSNKALAILNKPNDNIKKININTSEIEKKENKERQQITAENIFINNYSFYTDTPVDFAPHEENNDEYVIINNKEEIDDIINNKVDDVNLLSFHSVISFFDDLCQIGRDLIGKDSSKFKEIIIREITKINKNLPANVYLPFLTSNTRNYIIVHIPVTELKVFKTKERVPFMLVFEMIRLDEILYLLEKEKELPSLKNIITSTSSNTGDDFLETANTIKNDRLTEGLLENNNNNNDEFYGKTKTFQIKKSDSKEKKKNKKNKKKKKEKIEDQELLKIISESDIELSKEISLDLIEQEKYKNEDEKIIDDEEENKKFESPVIKNKINVDYSSNRKTGLITDNQFLKFEKISLNKNDSHEIVHKRSLSFNEEDKNRKSITKLIKEEEEEINTNTDKNIKEDEKKDEIKNDEINIEENLNIGDIGIQNEAKNSIEKNEKDNLILNKKPSFLDDECSSEQSDEEPKIITTNNKSNNSNKIIDLTNIFGEKFEDQKERLQYNSPFKSFKTFNIFKAIIKAGEDLKQEQFATQLISVFREIFSQNGVDCWLSPYEVISTGKDCGLVEMVSNSLSMDQIKQKTGLSLKQFYLEYFGNEKKKKYQQAVKNFISSLAGYSLVCYFLQIKDRHNGNILIDSKGHLIRIDFGFMLSNAPGKGIKFEKAPFKITDEMLDLLGGINSDNFKEYRKKLFKGYFAIYDNFEKIQKLAEFMFMGQGQYFPCFIEKENTLTNLKERLRPRDNMSKQQKMQYIDDLLSKSIDNWTTTYYDKFQYYIQGIFY
jgi:phosphatidylinositol 4-kinase